MLPVLYAHTNSAKENPAQIRIYFAPRCGEVVNIKITDVVTVRVINKAERERIAAEMKAISQKRYETYTNPEFTKESKV